MQKTFKYKSFIVTILLNYKQSKHGDLSKFEVFRAGRFLITAFN